MLIALVLTMFSAHAQQFANSDEYCKHLAERAVQADELSSNPDVIVRDNMKDLRQFAMSPYKKIFDDSLERKLPYEEYEIAVLKYAKEKNANLKSLSEQWRAQYVLQYYQKRCEPVVASVEVASKDDITQLPQRWKTFDVKGLRPVRPFENPTPKSAK